MRAVIMLIAVIEICIGLFTLAGMAAYTLLSVMTKPLSVLVFVTITAVISALLGTALLRLSKAAAVLLVFFSGYVIITKAMIAAGLFHFTGEMITFIPGYAKDLVSVGYHAFLIVFFSLKPVRRVFDGR